MNDGVEMVGRRALDSTKAVGLQELLAYIRQLHHHAYPKPIFGIEQLDKMFHKQNSNHLGLENPEELQIKVIEQAKPTLIEFTSVQPWPSTSILAYLIAMMLLPHSWDGIDIGGKNSVVILIDADAKFDLILLSDIMERHTKQFIPETSKSSIKALLEQAFSRLYLLRPKCLSSLISTLSGLPIALLSDENLSQNPVGLIAIDNLTTYYWSHRASKTAVSESNTLLSALATLISNVQDVPESSQQETEDEVNFANMVYQLRHLGSQFECPILVTTWDTASFAPMQMHVGRGRHHREEPRPPENNAPSLNPAFPTLPTLQLTVRRVPCTADNLNPMQHNSGVKFTVTDSSPGSGSEKSWFAFLVGSDGIPVFESHRVEKMGEDVTLN